MNFSAGKQTYGIHCVCECLKLYDIIWILVQVSKHMVYIVSVNVQNCMILYEFNESTDSFYTPSNEIKGKEVYWRHQIVGWYIGESSCLKLLPQFSSYLLLHVTPLMSRCDGFNE